MKGIFHKCSTLIFLSDIIFLSFDGKILLKQYNFLTLICAIPSSFTSTPFNYAFLYLFYYFMIEIRNINIIVDIKK